MISLTHRNIEIFLCLENVVCVLLLYFKHIIVIGYFFAFWYACMHYMLNTMKVMNNLLIMKKQANFYSFGHCMMIIRWWFIGERIYYWNHVEFTKIKNDVFLNQSLSFWGECTCTELQGIKVLSKIFKKKFTSSIFINILKLFS